MKTIELELLEQNGLKAIEKESSVEYVREMVSPENNESSCKLTIYFNGEKWCAAVEDYFGKNKWYSGTWYFSAKYLKRLITTLHNRLSFYGF